jgi:uncharacterized membrane protein
MQTSNNTSSPVRLPKWILITLLGAALVGFADASYLTAEHIRGVVPPCALADCDQVLTSAYASIGGLPVAALGMVYYGTVLVLLIAFFDTANRRFLHLACWLISAGMLGTLYFVGVQLFLIKAICTYCMISAATTTILFLAAVVVMRRD